MMIVGFLFSFVFLNSLNAKVLGFENSQESQLYSQETASDEIKIVTYNLHNLFDTEHDHGKNDYEFLALANPDKNCSAITNDYYRKICKKTDWTPLHLETKLENIEEALSYQGDLPDILAVQEIENAHVAEMLRKKLQYDSFVITESPDKRGIDVATFYKKNKLEYISDRSIQLKGVLFDESPSRNILEVNFKIRSSGSLLSVYNNHWPSQSNSTEFRISAAKQLREAINKKTRETNSDLHSVIVGDFNTLDSEVPNPIHNYLHENSWKNSLLDTHQLWGRENTYSQIGSMTPPGTYWYWKRNSWNRLDRILISKNLFDKVGLEFALSSFRIVADHRLMREDRIENSSSFFNGSENKKVPKKCDHRKSQASEQGFSDHLMVVIKLQL